MPRPRNTVQAGYGQQHKRLRAHWAQRVSTGSVRCARCRQFIRPGEKWALDHADLPNRLAHQLGLYLGPAHVRCNQAARNRRYARQAEPPRPRALSFFDPPSKAGRATT